MTGNVKIQITAVHDRPGEEPERIETVSAGRYYFRNGRHYVEYEETDPESGETSKSRLSLRGGCLEIRKAGACLSRLVFEENRKSRSQYVTPLGSLMAETDVKRLRVDEREELLGIRVDYSLALNGAKTADSSVCIRITPETEG